MEVISRVEVLDIDGEEIGGAGIDKQFVEVKSCWNNGSGRVVLSINGKEFSVLSDDLQNAIMNAINN